MKREDVILRGLVFDGEVSLAVADTTALVNEAIRVHGLSPLSAAALGRTLTVAAYMCSALKTEGSALSVTIKGNGVGGPIYVSGDKQLHMRGYIDNPHAELPPNALGKLDVGGCVGRRGTFTVIRDDGEGIPFVGTSPLVSGEIAEDLSAYFLTSEQRPTAVALGVKIGTDGTCVGAGGVFLQPLPGAGEEALDFAQRRIADYASVSSVIEREGARRVLADFGAENVSVRDVRFVCHCSRERAASAVLAMGGADARALLAEQGAIRVHCHYCNTEYTFDEDDLRKLFGENP